MKLVSILWTDRNLSPQIKKTRLASRSTVYSQRPLWRLPEKNEGRRNGWEEKSGGGIDGRARGLMLEVLSEAPPAWVTETLWKPLPGPVNLPRKHTGGHYKVVLIG